MLLCWKDDGDNRPSFENIVEMIQNILINTDSQSNGPRPKGGHDSYVLISDLSSSGFTDYDGQTLFSNGSLSFDCDGSGEQNMTKAHTECYEVFYMQRVLMYGALVYLVTKLANFLLQCVL